MGIGTQQTATWAIRDRMYSPGRPPVWQRDQVQRFWVGIANGLSSEVAALSWEGHPPLGVGGSVNWWDASCQPGHLV